MKNIKSIFVAVAVVITGLCMLVSCNRKEKEEAKFDRQIEQLVSGLTFPQKLNDNSSLTACSYHDRMLTYKVEIDKKRLAAMKLDQKRGETLEKLRTGLLPRALVQALVKANASLQYIYFNDNDSVSFIFSPDELKLPE